MHHWLYTDIEEKHMTTAAQKPGRENGGILFYTFFYIINEIYKFHYYEIYNVKKGFLHYKWNLITLVDCDNLKVDIIRPWPVPKK